MKAVAFFLLVYAASTARAQGNEGVTAWWPDVRQNVIWTATTVGGPKSTQNYHQALQSCSSLVIGNMSGWRLPTINELDGVTGSDSRDVLVVDRQGDYHDTGRAGGYSFLRFDGSSYANWIWTSTSAPDNKMVTLNLAAGWHTTSKPTDSYRHGAYCVRTMEPEIEGAAKQALPSKPVASLQDLRNLIPLRQAYDAYGKHDYATSFADAQAAAALNSKSAEAIYAEGLSQAGLGHWADALADFKIVKKMDWDSMSYPITWAQNNEKVAASGKMLNPKKNTPPNWSFGG